MLSCGKYVIATNYSAHTEFLTKENAALLPINGIEPAYDGIWFHEQGNWAKIDENTKYKLIDAMRNFHQTKQMGHLTLNDAGIETARKFTWENTAKEAIEGLSLRIG